MIVLITEPHTIKYRDGTKETYLVVSHGVDTETFRDVVLPQMKLRDFFPKRYDEDMCEWVIDE